MRRAPWVPDSAERLRVISRCCRRYSRGKQLHMPVGFNLFRFFLRDSAMDGTVQQMIASQLVSDQSPSNLYMLAIPWWVWGASQHRGHRDELCRNIYARPKLF